MEVIATAQALAGVDARSIGYIEAHGTATPLGDPIEIAALTQAFRASTDDVGFCRIGSLKANIGHLDAAAGVAGLIKAVLALKYRVAAAARELPEAESAARAGGEPLRRERIRRALARGDGHAAPRRRELVRHRRHQCARGAGGGTRGPTAEPPRQAHLLVLSARTPMALDRTTEALAGHLRAHPDVSLADVEYTLQVGRQEFSQRRAVVVRDSAHALEVLAEPRRAGRRRRVRGWRSAGRVSVQRAGEPARRHGSGAVPRRSASIGTGSTAAPPRSNLTLASTCASVLSGERRQVRDQRDARHTARAVRGGVRPCVAMDVPRCVAVGDARPQYRRVRRGAYRRRHVSRRRAGRGGCARRSDAGTSAWSMAAMHLRRLRARRDCSVRHHASKSRR